MAQWNLSGCSLYCHSLLLTFSDSNTFQVPWVWSLQALALPMWHCPRKASNCVCGESPGFLGLHCVLSSTCCSNPIFSCGTVRPGWCCQQQLPYCWQGQLLEEVSPYFPCGNQVWHFCHWFSWQSQSALLRHHFPSTLWVQRAVQPSSHPPQIEHVLSLIKNFFRGWISAKRIGLRST